MTDETPVGDEVSVGPSPVDPQAGKQMPAAGGEPTETTVEVADAAAGMPPGAQAGSPSGVTMPVAVPVTVALVLGLAIGLILGWVIPRPGADTTATVAATEAAASPDAAAGATDGSDESPATSTTLSPATPAPVPGGPDGTDELAGLVLGTQGPLVEVFEDYVCPFCAQLELSSGPSLRESALSGEFRLVVHPIAFLTEDSPRAANASACVYQHEDTETWIAFHELLYERQDPSEAVGQFAVPVLQDLAVESGATAAEVAPCIEGGTYDAWVAGLTQQSFARGVRGTPTIAVDGTITDVAPLLQ